MSRKPIVAVVGATGQVGGVMRRLLEERDFPLEQVRYFASARSAGTTLPWRGTEIVVEDAADSRRLGHRHRPVLRWRCDLEGNRGPLSPRPVPSSSTTPRRGAWIPTCRSSSARSTRTRSPRCARASSPTRTARPWPRCRCSSRSTPRRACAGSIVSTFQAVSGSGLAGVEELDSQVRAVVDQDITAADPRRLGRRLPRAEEVRAPDRLRRHPAGRQHRRRRLVRDRRGAEAPQREPQDPGDPRPAGVRHVRPGAGVHRPLAVDQRRVRSADLGRACARRSWPTRSGVELSDVPTPLQAAGADPSFVGRIRQDQTVPDGRGLVLFVSNDNLRKGAALNAVQIAELVAATL